MKNEECKTPIQVKNGSLVEAVYDKSWDWGYRLRFRPPIIDPWGHEKFCANLDFHDHSEYNYGPKDDCKTFTLKCAVHEEIQNNLPYNHISFFYVADYSIKGWKKITEQHKEGDIVQGKIVTQTKDGLMVKIFNFDAILPLHELDSDEFRKPKDFIGQTLDVKILKIYQDLRKVIVSRKHLITSAPKKASNEKGLFEEVQMLKARIEKLEDELKKLKAANNNNKQGKSPMREAAKKKNNWW